MIIEVKEPKPLTFAELKAGDAFKLNTYNDIFMKTTTMNMYNAVRLDDGEMFVIARLEPVTLFKCKVVEE
jgi:hypothetical protein